MALWWFDAVKGGSSTFTDAKGEEQTVVLKPGQRFERDDPCEMAAFLTGWNSTFVEEQPGVYRSVMRACGDQVAALQAAEMAETIFVTTSSPSSGGPPVVEDNPTRQNAPGVRVSGQLSVAPWPTPPLGGAPADLVFDAKNPLSPRELVDLVRPSLETPDMSDKERMRRWLRNEPEPGEPHPTHAGETTRFPVTGGDPVELFQGTLVITQVDLDVPTAVLPLRLVRMYRSGRPYFGPWGYGWDHNYNVYLRSLSDGSIAYWTGALHESVFRWTGEAFEPERGVHARLSRSPDAPDVYLLVHPGGLSLRFARPDRWTDATRIPLVEIQDRHGNLQALTYGAENQVRRVTDAEGRALVFDYGDCGLLEAVEDHAGRRVRYTHHPDVEHLVRVTVPPTAAYPQGASTRYAYDEFTRHPAMQHNLLSITDADGATYLENRYGNDPSGWSFNRVVEQIYGGFQYLYDYEAIQFVPANPIYVDAPALRAVVRMPDSALHTYTFNYRGDLLDYRFRLSRDRSYRVVASQWSYDEQGNTTVVVDPEGGRTVFTYDAGNLDPCARGNLLEIERVAPPAFVAESRIVLRARYEPVYQLCREQVDERGGRTRFVYDLDTSPGPAATGRIERIELPDATLLDGSAQRSAVLIETNVRGQVTATVSPGGVRDETHYAAAGASIGFPERLVRDAGGVAFEIECGYDLWGYPRRWTEPGGRVTEFHSDARGQLEELVLPAVAGAVARTRREYTGDGLVHRIERPRGAYADGVIQDDFLLEDLKRNALGHLVRATLGANTARPATWDFKVDSQGRTVREVDPVGLVVERGFDERGLMLCESVTPTRREELTTEWTYDRCGRLVRVEAPDGRIARTEYDAWGRVARVTLPNGSETVFVWGVADQVAEVRVEGDPGDCGPRRVLSRRRFFYDERGRVVRTLVDVFEEDPAAAVELTTGYLYDGDDRVREARGPRGAITRCRIDGLDRPERIEDTLGNAVQILYGPTGDVGEVRVEATEPSGVRTLSSTYAHDARGRLRGVTDPAGSTVEIDYDDRDLPVERREPLGVVVRARHGLMGELREIVSDPEGLALVSRWESDLLGRTTRFTDPTEEVTAWTRDRAGRELTVALADGAIWTRTYGDGALIGETAPSGARVRFDYEPKTGRLHRISCVPAAGTEPVPDHVLSYDGLDRVVRAEAGGHEVARRFDSVDRLVEERFAGRTFRCTYRDLQGSSLLRFPDGREEEHAWDLLGRTERVTLVRPGDSVLGPVSGPPGTVLVETAYAGAAQVASQRFGNGSTSVWKRDDAGRLVSVEHAAPGASALDAVRYRHDARSRRRVVQTAGAPEENHLFAYDVQSRLSAWRTGFVLPVLGDVGRSEEQAADIASAESAAASAAFAERYALDGSDTRTALTRLDGGTALEIAMTQVAGHKVTQVGADAISYSVDGNRIADPHRVIVYDGFGRVVCVETPGGVTLMRCTYDPLGRWSGGETGGVRVHRLHLGGLCLQEEDESGEVLCQRTHLPVAILPAVETRAVGAFYLHLDGHENLLVVTDADSAAVERYRYDAFGAPRIYDGGGTVERGASAVGIQPYFGGMPYLSATGLYVTPHRHYDPRTGLFLGRDPLLHAVSPSPYAFAGHDPVNRIDPEGDIAANLVVGFTLGAIGAVTGMASVVLRDGDYDAADVFWAGAIGAGAGATSGLTFGLVSGAVGGALLGTGAAASSAAGSLGVSVTSGFVGGAASGLASGVFSGALGGLVDGMRYGGDLGSKVAQGATLEGASGMASGAVGGALFQGALRLGALPNRSWSAMRMHGLKRTAILLRVLGRGILSPYGLGAAGIGFASAYSGGVARRSTQGNHLNNALKDAVNEGIFGAFTAAFSAGMHPTTWQYWRTRFDPGVAAHIEQTRAGAAHHQRNVARYPELATLRNSSLHSDFERKNQPFIAGNIEGPFSEYNSSDAIGTHQQLHGQWQGGQSGSSSNWSTHGPWTPSWNVSNGNAASRMTQRKK